MSGQRKRKLADLKLDVKRKPGRRRGRWRIRKEVSTDFIGISQLLSSFYPGTKLLFWHRLVKFGKSAE